MHCAGGFADTGFLGEEHQPTYIHAIHWCPCSTAIQQEQRVCSSACHRSSICLRQAQEHDCTCANWKWLDSSSTSTRASHQIGYPHFVTMYGTRQTSSGLEAAGCWSTDGHTAISRPVWRLSSTHRPHSSSIRASMQTQDSSPVSHNQEMW